MTPSEQVRAKFQQAHQHAAAMGGHIAAFLKDEPYEVHGEEEPSGDLAYKVRIKSRPPIAISLTLGDAVHNARTALEHLAWQLVIANGGTPGKGTGWPTTDNPKSATSRLKGASPQVLDLIMNSIKPFPGGDERFPLLHALDVEDKHHAIVPVGAANKYMNLHHSVKLPGMDDFGHEVVIGIPPADRQFPLSDGLKIGGVMKAARVETDIARMGTSFTFDLCFGSDSASAGEPLIPTIPDLISGVERAVAPLMALLK